MKTQSGFFADMDMLEVGNGGMTDSEYLIHFSMWALMSSPLLIGTNFKSLKPADLSILSNPAVIALNQDPSANAAVRRWRVETQDRDEHGFGEISLWTRDLADGDVAFALVNAGTSARTMTASSVDLFGDWGAVRMDASWEVYDVWANRMGESEAGMLLQKNRTGVAAVEANSLTRWNATEISYAEGIKAGKEVLIGKKVGVLGARAGWKWESKGRGVGLFRLRMVTKKKDEL